MHRVVIAGLNGCMVGLFNEQTGTITFVGDIVDVDLLVSYTVRIPEFEIKHVLSIVLIFSVIFYVLKIIALIKNIRDLILYILKFFVRVRAPPLVLEIDIYPFIII